MLIGLKQEVMVANLLLASVINTMKVVREFSIKFFVYIKCSLIDNSLISQREAFLNVCDIQGVNERNKSSQLSKNYSR